MVTVSDVGNALEDIGGKLFEGVSASISWLGSSTKSLISWLESLISNSIKKLTDEVTDFKWRLWGGLTNSFEWVKASLLKIWDKASEGLAKSFEWTKATFKKLWDGIKAKFSEYLDNVKKYLNDLKERAKKSLSEYLDRVQENPLRAWYELKGIVDNFSDYVKIWIEELKAKASGKVITAVLGVFGILPSKKKRTGAGHPYKTEYHFILTDEQYETLDVEGNLEYYFGGLE